MKKAKTALLGIFVGLAAVAPSAFAAISTTEVTNALTDAGAAVATVGAAVLVVHVGVKVYKYIRGAM